MSRPANHASIRSMIMTGFMVAALSGCGSEDVYSIRDTSADPNGIAAAIGTESAGRAVVFAAAPATYASMTFCIADLTGKCATAAKTLTFERTAGDRKIFKSSVPSELVTNTVWLFSAVNNNGTQINQKVRLTSADTNIPVTATGKLNWKVLLMASDQGNTGAWIDAFDNARTKLKQIFSGKGVPETNFRELSLHQNHQSQTVKPTSAVNFAESIKSFGIPAANDACIVHMTSHGSRDGFNLGSNRLSPQELDQALTAGCGDRPTVVLISACFSGLYVLDSSGVKKPNRIILTAARHDVTSFGCSPENEYTYWDGCLIESLPTASKWQDLATKIVSCITRKEGGSTASFPQTFIGDAVKDLAIPQL